MNPILYRDLRPGDCLVFWNGLVELVLEATPFSVCTVTLNSRHELKPTWSGHDSHSEDEVYTSYAKLIRHEP